jgi:hypothetical protein
MYSDTDSIQIHINAGCLIPLGDMLGDMTYPSAVASSKRSG